MTNKGYEDNMLAQTINPLDLNELNALERGTSCAWTIDLRPNGGILSTNGEFDLRAGDGIVISFELSTGVSMLLPAQVRWVRMEQSTDPPGAWVDFAGLDAAERREFHWWLRSLRDRGKSTLDVQLIRKFSVRRNGPTLSVWISGRLEPGESAALGSTVSDITARASSRALAVFIDVRNFKPSPEDSVANIRVWLKQLAQRGPVLGVLIGQPSVGTMQFSRLAREAGLANSLVNCHDFDSARSTWALICEQIVRLETATQSGGYSLS